MGREAHPAPAPTGRRCGMIRTMNLGLAATQPRMKPIRRQLGPFRRLRDRKLTEPAPRTAAHFGADDHYEGGSSWADETPIDGIAPTENFIVGTWKNLRSTVGEFFMRDAAREYETATDSWDKLDAARRNTLLNKLYHHVAKPIAAGAGEGIDGMAHLLGDTPGTLEQIGSSIYAGARLLYNDPEAVGEAAYRAYDEFDHLTPTQQKDIYLRFASDLG